MKALFFDNDGTLVSFQTHKIPASTIFALTQAKANGAKVFISTGRPRSYINNLDAIEHLIDGYITTTGALCTVGDEVVCCQPIPHNDVRSMLHMAQTKGFACAFIGEQDNAVVNYNEELVRIFKQLLNIPTVDQVVPVENVMQQQVLQLIPLITIDEEPAVMHGLPHCVSSRWHPAFTDITSCEADKGKGLESICRHLQISPEDTIAFGDGGNDIAILCRAGTGVAMGNATDLVKQHADLVTTSVDDEGILNALRILHII